MYKVGELSSIVLFKAASARFGIGLWAWIFLVIFEYVGP